MPNLISLLTFAAAVFAVWLVFKIFSFPIKIFFRMLINAIIGAVILLAFNFFGNIIGFTIPITWLTALIAGVFGIPGVGAIIIYMLLFP
ncbi:MAG TPA: pro-sigmaK processing inhibitor BofA [Clostridiales bacterium]|jgi:inhibitor of the pro-sigma K processing machinery|nr:pro-sigmaK processing inhibitor BofA [Clostridiales bacterium]